MPENCLLENNYTLTNCPKETAGARAFLYLANLSEVESWTAGDPGEYTDFDLASGASLYKYEVSKDTLQFLEELQGAEEDLGGFQQDVNFMLKSLNLQTRNALNSLNGIDTVAFVPLKNGIIFIVGKDLGCRMVVNTTDSAAENYGETVTLRATQMPEKRFILDAGSTTQTLALLESKVTAS